MMTWVMGGLFPIPKPAVTTRCSTGPLCGSAEQNELHFTFYIYIFIHSMKSFDSLYCEFVSALVRELDWKKCIIYGICTFWTQKRCIPCQEQILHIQGITSENVVLSLKKFLISVLWDFLVLILRDLIHSTGYSMVLGKWGPVTAQNCVWNCSIFSLAKASCT